MSSARRTAVQAVGIAVQGDANAELGISRLCCLRPEQVHQRRTIRIRCPFFLYLLPMGTFLLLSLLLLLRLPLSPLLLFRYSVQVARKNLAGKDAEPVECLVAVVANSALSIQLGSL